MRALNEKEFDESIKHFDTIEIDLPFDLERLKATVSTEVPVILVYEMDCSIELKGIYKRNKNGSVRDISELYDDNIGLKTSEEIVEIIDNHLNCVAESHYFLGLLEEAV